MRPQRFNQNTKLVAIWRFTEDEIEQINNNIIKETYFFNAEQIHIPYNAFDLITVDEYLLESKKLMFKC